MPNNTLRPTVSFEDPFQSGKPTPDRSRSTSRIRDEIETPNGPRRRSDHAIPLTSPENKEDDDSRRPSRWSSFTEQTAPPQADAIRSLSVSVIYDPPLPKDEPNWPSGWRPWACLLGGFLLMFNSWGIVNVSIPSATARKSRG